ncbi:transcriptional regulator [Thermanaerovibrio velox DSM 12556]|uniref:Transcriptional regulator n=1 Tax=Thermanaerovibrio velox DSM 12556 TaxID=926567 RepID=H0UND5_9BACT|nr:GntR family transcriptional regulator [Thermanaerovibrio velox]EHM09342.1 transcriptional regulator [Thermanaerovibrio velox DSM 12556]
MLEPSLNEPVQEHRLYTTSAEYVYSTLRREIITKQLTSGTRLPEVAIATRLKVSRTPVREALRRLASEGLVLIIPNSGARVAAPRRKEMEDAYVVREELECLAARLACANVTEKHLRRLEECVADEERAFGERNLEAYLEINEAFHRIIADASGNRVLREYVENILARTNVYIVFYDPFYVVESNPSVQEHRLIIEALRARDAQEAVERMRSHIRLSKGSLSEGELKAL